MPSIMSQNLYQRVTTDALVRKIEKIDPGKFSKSILQISDQQSRDKEYEKNIVYLRTYIASLQAKLNTVVEELNNSYDTMLNEMLYKKADSKDTAKLLNNLPNASSLDLCGGGGVQKYDPKALELTPYSTNVKNYEYNTMFGSKGLDLSNYYDYGQTNNTTVARSYYEKGDPNASSPSNYHELGTSVFGTLNYLWAWDLDRVNATYATTKDAYVDADGNLHVPTGDPRAGASGVVEDSKLDIANGNSTTGGNANNLQVNVTALQPNRGVFLPNTEKPNLETIILKENFEERNTGPDSLPNGWLSTYAQSMLGNTWSSYGLQNYDGINQWGVDSTPPVSDNTFEKYFDLHNIAGSTDIPAALPQPTYSTETAGYLSSSSANFGNIRSVTYDDIVYDPHSTYRFDPNLIREHFDTAQAVTNTATGIIDVNNLTTATNGLNFTVTGEASMVDTTNSFDAHTLNNIIPTATLVPYQPSQITTGTQNPPYGNAFGDIPDAVDPRNVLDISYANDSSSTVDGTGVTVSTPKFDLREFEDVIMDAKSYYNLDYLIDKYYGYSQWTTGKCSKTEHHQQTYNEISKMLNQLKAVDSSTGTSFWESFKPTDASIFQKTNYWATPQGCGLGILIGALIGAMTGGIGFILAGAVIGSLLNQSGGGGSGDPWKTILKTLGENSGMSWALPNPPTLTNNMFDLIQTSAAQGRDNMGIDFKLLEDVFSTAGKNFADFRNGVTPAQSTPTVSGMYFDSTVAAAANPTLQEANATRWQLDDVNIKARGYSRGEMISPKMDFSQMESGYLEFYDKIETKDTTVTFNDFTKKQVYYSFDYDETNPNAATWNLMASVSKTGVSNQEWELNSGEIPCAGGEDNVRVKFVFDTRNNVSVKSNAAGSNIVEYSDFNGWNVDNIKLIGRKANPTDFYYYRQDLNSEFVTGAGAKIVNTTTTDIAGFADTLTGTNISTNVAIFKNNAPVVGATPSPVIFNIPSTIDTTTVTAPKTMNVNAATNVAGSVTQTVNNAGGPYGTQADSGGTLVSNASGGSSVNVFANAGDASTMLKVGQSVILGGTAYTISSVTSTPGVLTSGGATGSTLAVASTAGLSAGMKLNISGSNYTIAGVDPATNTVYLTTTIPGPITVPSAGIGFNTNTITIPWFDSGNIVNGDVVTISGVSYNVTAVSGNTITLNNALPSSVAAGAIITGGSGGSSSISTIVGSSSIKGISTGEPAALTFDPITGLPTNAIGPTNATITFTTPLATNYVAGDSIKLPITVTPKTLNWDITSTTAAVTGVSNSNISFVASGITQSPVPNPPTTTDPWVDALAWAVNPVTNTGPEDVALSSLVTPMTNNNYATFTPTSNPSATQTISNIDLTGLASANLTFNSFALDTVPNVTRTLEILNNAGAVVGTYPYTVGTPPTATPVSIDLIALGLAGQNNVKLRFTATSTNGLNNTGLSGNLWDISNIKVSSTSSSASSAGVYTSSFQTGPYAIDYANSTLNFDYSALTDPSGYMVVPSRKIYASTDNSLTWTEIFNAIDPTSNGVLPVYKNSTIDLSSIAPLGSSLRLKFESIIDVPDQVTIAPQNVFNIQNIKVNHEVVDGYNVAETTAPANTNRPNISFDPRGYNVEGRYTDVNGRTQISNTDFPMFSNTILTAVESDAARFQAYRGDTYAEWVGLNTKTPARVLDMLTGKVKPQFTGNFVISKDGLNNYYDTTKSGVPTDMYVDEALAINTRKIIGKTPTLDEINQGSTGWINATANGSGIWIPRVANTKYEETINSTYKNMTIWGKKTFLLDPLSALPADPVSTISANDDAYLYVNGFNVRSTAYAQSGSTLTMIDATDYSVGEIVMLNGITGTITAINTATAGANTITISGIPAVPAPSFPNIGTFDDLTVGKTPYTVYHTDPIKDTSGALITNSVTEPAQSNELTVTSVDHLKAGQTIYVNGQALLIETLTPNTPSLPPTGPGKITFSPLLEKQVLSGSLLAYSYTDAGAATNVAGTAVTPANPTGLPPAQQGLTNSNSTAMSYHIKPLLRKGFNTVGVKATEDKGTSENFNVTFGSTLTAMGDTNSGTGGASGIDTDITWALKVSPNGYDGSNPFYTGPASGYTNDSASPLYQDEIDSLFKTEKVDKMETTVHFINKDPNGVGKVSLIKGIEVNVTGEPTVQTLKRNSFSTETRKDGYVTTQLTKGFVNGLEQTGSGLALKFEPADMLGSSSLDYMTDLSGNADINVFFDKKDSNVNDATMNVTVKYIEDSNGDGKITGAELTELKTRIIGMQDTRNNTILNPNSDAPATAVAGLRERYAFVETTCGVVGAGATAITVVNTKNLAVGDYIRIEDGAGGHQAVQITSLSTLSGAGSVGFSPALQIAIPANARVTSYRLLTDVDQAEAAKLYLGSNYTTSVGAAAGYTSNDITVNEQYLVASKGRSGGSTATGNENKITARLKQILDGDEFQEMLKYGLLDGIYIAATASDNRGDQIVGKLMLDWDWRKKRVSVKQGSFSAIYKS